LNAQVQTALARTLMERIESLVGAPWRAEVLPAPESLRSTILLNLDLPPAELFAAVPEALKLDKIIFMTLTADARGFSVGARELDCRTRLYGPAWRRIVRQPQSLALDCYRAVIHVFRPVARIEEAESKASIVRLRAGGLVLDQESPCYVADEEILLPVLRNNERDGTFRSAAPMEWTFLEVQGRGEQNPNLLDCRVWSARPNPIQGRVSSRKEQYALRVRPTGGTTRLMVTARVGRDEQPYPIPGLEVYAKIPEEPPPAPEPAPTPAAGTEPPPTAQAAASESGSPPASAEDVPTAASESPASAPAQPTAPQPARERFPPVLLGHTDWRGTIEVGPGESPLRLVYLKNGGQLLARLPIVPGLEATLTAEVPDDAPRLAAEGFVKGLQGQLMDLEAQRRILAERIRLRIKEGKLPEAEQLLEELKQLPTRNDLIRQLDQQQNQQVVSPNAIVQGRIDRLYGDMREALGKYLAPSLLNDLIGEVNQARGAPPGTPVGATAATTPGA